MVKVLVFHLGFCFSGGGEKLVLEEIKGLSRLGYEVKCFSPIVDEKRCFPDAIKNYPIYSILPQLPERFPKRYTLQLLITCALFPFLSFRFRGYDVVFAANQPSLYFAFWLKKFFGIPYVAYLAQPLRLLHPRKVDKDLGLFLRDRLDVLPRLAKFFRGFIDWADRSGVVNANKILVNGEYVKSKVEKTYRITSENCPAGCHPVSRVPSFSKRFSGTIRVWQRVIKKPYILITNRHFPQKRFEYAISFLPLILERIPKIKLVITGEETPYTLLLKQFVKQLGIEKGVVFTDLVTERDLPTLYKNAAVYIYTAPDEDFGMGVIEAMAVGTPTVAWNSAGPSYIMRGDKGGFLAEPFKTADFSKKILRLLTDKNLWQKKSQEARRHAQKNFSSASHSQRLDKAIRESIT